MDKQRTVNTVTANDEWSQSLMKMYENWMGGDTFQNSTIKEDEIPTGQKQGGGDGAPFVTAIGSLPAIETDKSTTIPVIPELGVTDKTEKNTAQTDSANPGEPPVALKGTMTIGQGSLSSGQRQSQGKQLAYTNVVTREDATYGYDKKGNSLNPKDKKKLKKEDKDCSCDTHESHSKCGDDCGCEVTTEEKKYVNKKVAKIMSYKNKDC